MNAPDLTVAGCTARIAELDAAQAECRQRATEISADSAREAAALRASLGAARNAAQFDREARRALLDAERVIGEKIAGQQQEAEMRVAALIRQAAELGRQRNELAGDRTALARLDALDELTAATHAANRVIAQIETAPADRAALQERLAAALLARRRAWLVWHRQFGGVTAPELLRLPAEARDFNPENSDATPVE